MGADDQFGARLWRSKAGVGQPDGQEDWEEVSLAANGYPFGITGAGQVDHIDSLQEFQGYLFVSTASEGAASFGARVFRSPSGDPASWEDAIQSTGTGFGDANNTNFYDMQVFEGYLCGGTENNVDGAQVWCTTNGTDWSQKNVSGFGSVIPDERTPEIRSSAVFEKALYFGARNGGDSVDDASDDVAKLYRATDLDGMPVWEEVYSGVSGSAVDNAVVYRNGLYVAISNPENGFELWRTTGTLATNGRVDWEQVGRSGLGDQNNSAAQLAVFNNYLYAWTTNFLSGQQVLRLSCPSNAPTPTATVTATLTSTVTITSAITDTPVVTSTTSVPAPSETPVVTEPVTETTTPETQGTSTEAPVATTTESPQPTQ